MANREACIQAWDLTFTVAVHRHAARNSHVRSDICTTTDGQTGPRHDHGRIRAVDRSPRPRPTIACSR
eukprot:4489983-Pleurochrysis_carterae.AAC.1